MGANHLLAAVLQVPHERFLDSIEFGKLHANGLAGPLKVLRALRKVLASLDARRCRSERTLWEPANLASALFATRTSETHLELLVDALQAVNRSIQASDLVAANVKLLLEVLHLAQVRVALSGVLRLEFVLP